MPRILRYVIGLTSMAAALVIAVFMPEPMIWVARAAFVGPFLAMLWMRRQYRALRTIHVFTAALSTGLVVLAGLAGVTISGGEAWPVSLTVTLALPAVTALLITLSFHHLTMGAGRMA